MRLPTLAIAAVVLLATSCASRPPVSADAASATLGQAAEAYVRLSLEIGEHEPGYIDAYYGPADWAAQAKAAKRPLPTLRTDVDALIARLQGVDNTSLSALERRRKQLLIAQLTAAKTRMAMLAGEKLSFDDEAEGLYGIRPNLKPLSAYDPVLARIDKLLPGTAPLWQRVDDLVSQTEIPPDRVDRVMRAAIAECRRRTVEYIPLPADETFTLELVTKQPWSGYNWYKGNATSLIQINTDLPVLMSRVLDLGCHEGYPGHHVLNLLLEQRLYRQRGWVEFSVYPLYSPQSFIAEGSANFGIELAFAGNDRQTYERNALYPLAGLDPGLAARDTELQQARGALAGARLTIAREYLDGRITRAEALALAQKYQLLSPERAEQSIAFTDKYRSYVINYGLGRDLVSTYVDSAGPDRKARWAAMERVLSEPTIPADLSPPPPATNPRP